MKKKEYYERNRNSYNAIAHKYAKNYESIELMNKERNDFLALIPEASNILDLGCGHGRDLEYFISKGHSLTGIDISSSLLKIARERAPDAKLIELNLLDIDSIEDLFNGIWCNAVLHHLKKDDFSKVLEKIHNRLNYGGVFFLSVKNNINSHWDSKYPSHPRYYTFFEKEFVESILSNLDFEIISSEIAKEVGTSNIQKRDWLQLMARRKPAGNRVDGPTSDN